MKTQYFTATSLDGFIATEDDSLDWLFPLGNLNDTSYPTFIAEVGALAMGSSTYEWMLRHADLVAKETGSPLAVHATVVGVLQPVAAGPAGRRHPLCPGRRATGPRGHGAGRAEQERVDRRRR